MVITLADNERADVSIFAQPASSASRCFWLATISNCDRR